MLVTYVQFDRISVMKNTSRQSSLFNNSVMELVEHYSKNCWIATNTVGTG